MCETLRQCSHHFCRCRDAGIKGAVLCFACASNSGVIPGEIINCAPAATAASYCSGFNTVPAPTSTWVCICNHANGLQRQVRGIKTEIPPSNSFRHWQCILHIPITITGTIGDAEKTSSGLLSSFSRFIPSNFLINPSPLLFILFSEKRWHSATSSPLPCCFCWHS